MRNSISGSAITEDGRINISLLEKEIRQEISSDAQYKAEDQMKKKAILMSKIYLILHYKTHLII